MKKLDLGSALKFAFDVIKKNWRIWIPLVLLYSILLWIFNAIKPVYSPTPWKEMAMMWEQASRGSFILFEVIYPILLLVVGALTTIYLIKLGIVAYKQNDKLTFSKISVPIASLLFKYIWVTILFFLFILAGFVALIIPGFIVFLTYFWVSYILVDHPNLSVKELFHKASTLSKGIRWSLIGYFLLFFVVQQLVNLLLIYLFKIDFTSASIFTWKHGVVLFISSFIFNPIWTFTLCYLYQNVQEQEKNMVEQP